MSEQPSLRERVAAALAGGGQMLTGSDYADADVALAAVSAHITEGLDEAAAAAIHRTRAWGVVPAKMLPAHGYQSIVVAALHSLGLLPSPEQEQSGE